MKTALTLVLCIYAAPALANACADFKAALVVLEATLQAAKSFENSNPKPPDDSPEEQEWLSSKRAYFAAMDRAFEAVREPRQAVEESIQDEHAVTTINHIVSIFGPSLKADASLGRWHVKEGLFANLELFSPVEEALTSVGEAARRAHHEALKAACALGLARSD